jgi:hypothetical protein
LSSRNSNKGVDIGIHHGVKPSYCAMKHLDQHDEESKPTRKRHLLIALFLAVQIGAPVSYYASSRVYDERFAWRMFSPIRMVRCNVRFVGVKSGRPEALHLTREVAQPWARWMLRGNARVIRAFGDYWCEKNFGDAPHLTVEANCPLPAGTIAQPVPPEEDLCAP